MNLIIIKKAFIAVGNLSKSKEIKARAKFTIFSFIIEFILLYGSEMFSFIIELVLL